MDAIRNANDRELIELANESLDLIQIRAIHVEPDRKVDATVEVKWNSHIERYACEIKRSNTPRILETAIAQAHYAASMFRIRPLVLCPYLSEEHLKLLQENGVSGIDLCGNAILLSEQFTLWRSGQPNRFRLPNPNLNPFRGDNSIFSRCFLLKPSFDSLSELQDFALQRMLKREADRIELLSLGTASKTTKALEEELILTKSGRSLRLVDRHKLLRQLRRNYQPQADLKRVGKISLPTFAAWNRLHELHRSKGVRSVATGLYSATYYHVLASSDKLSLYVDDIDLACEALEFRETRAFANCELIRTVKNIPYFDLHAQDAAWYASPIQTWLELANGNAREQEAAADLEKQIQLGGINLWP